MSPGKLPQATEGCVLTLSILTAGQEGAGWDGWMGWDGTLGALAHGGLGILPPVAAHPPLELQKRLKGAITCHE